MSIMAAGMHLPLDFGTIGDLIGLLQGQSIHIRPDGHGLPPFFSLQNADYARLGQSSLNLQSKFFEPSGNQLGGLYLFKP